MAIVTSYDWESDTWTNHTGENPTRQAWRQSVQDVTDKAKTALPECNGRVESAAKIVLAGDVELLPDGKAKVASQSNGSTQYFVVNGTCECLDFKKAPHGFCKHRLAYGILKRASALFKNRIAQLDTPHPPTADEPVRPSDHVQTPQSVPAQYIVQIQGRPFVKFTGLLQMAHERGLASLTAEWTYNDTELSLAHAVARFSDGRIFEESGDASPSNVTKKVAVHFRRVALTRAKARVLRDALGVELVAVEELETE